MALNPKDENKTEDQLVAEANTPGLPEERVKEILSQLVVRTVKSWKDPGWFTNWAVTTPKKDAEDFLQETLESLIEMELFEYCKDVELMKGQLQVFHAMKNKAEA